MVTNNCCHVAEACVAIYDGAAHVRNKATQTAFSQIILVYEKRLCCEIYNTDYEHDNATKVCGMYNKVQAFNLRMIGNNITKPSQYQLSQKITRLKSYKCFLQSIILINLPTHNDIWTTINRKCVHVIYVNP